MKTWNIIYYYNVVLIQHSISIYKKLGSWLRILPKFSNFQPPISVTFFNTVISVYFDINNVLNFNVTNCCSVDIKSERLTLDLQFGGTSLTIGVHQYCKDI